MSKFKQLLDNIEVLTEDAKSSIQEAFETAVNTKVEERVKLEVDNALSKIDEQHAQSLTKLLEKVDEDHAKKFQIALQKLDEDHTKKLKNVKYRN
jgi:hydrogenase maturation factor